MSENTEPQYSFVTRFFFSSSTSRFVPFVTFLWVAFLLAFRLFSPAKGSLLQPWIDVLTYKGGLAACTAVMVGCAYVGSCLYRQHPLEETSNTSVAYFQGAFFFGALLALAATL